jgi:hypothetical protein
MLNFFRRSGARTQGSDSKYFSSSKKGEFAAMVKDRSRKVLAFWGPPRRSCGGHLF